MAAEDNDVQTISIGGVAHRMVTIRELFCYRNPATGWIVKKSYAERPMFQVGWAPRKSADRQKLIARHKRRIERYNTRATAPGRPPIVEFWWEPPGDPPGRYNEDGSPVDLAQYRAAGGTKW